MDLHSAEQDRLLKKYYLGLASKQVDDPWHANGPKSVSPFVPCASGRIPVVLRAARLTSEDVLWDIGCGDGRVLHQAALQYGCTCVGMDIDASCVAEGRRRAECQGISHLCNFFCADMMALQPGCLRGESGWTKLGDAAEVAYASRPLRAPTVVLLFITSHGLARLTSFLHSEWQSGQLRVLTCVEHPNECFDFEAEDALFDTAAERASWPVYTAHASHGVFVIPPQYVSVSEWAAAEAEHEPNESLDEAQADAAEVRVLTGLLSDAEIAELVCLGELMAREEEEQQSMGVEEELQLDWSLVGEDMVAEAEDAIHRSATHRVIHLHRAGRVQEMLPTLLEKVLARIYIADAQCWRLLVGRSIALRSVELHVYRPGGGVTDPQHRDCGSLLTLSVLLSDPSMYKGGDFSYIVSRNTESGWSTDVVWPPLGCGDGVLFPSEKRHNVTTLKAGLRRSLVVELWAREPTSYNRHR